MRRIRFGLFILSLMVATGAVASTLEEVAASTRQWTGVAVSREGRIFVNFPRWSLDVPVSVGEVLADGTVTPYPDASWQDWQPDSAPDSNFVCVQSVHVDAKNRLWILDPASAWLRGVVPGGAKLLQVDLETNTVARTWFFDETTAPKESYLNDVRIDTVRELAFMTDSSLGALVVLDLKSGAVRRVLEGHPSTRAEQTVLKIGGRPFPMKIHSDGIALDAKGGWLYWQALTARTLYRLPVAALADADADVAAAIETVGESGASDGLLWTDAGVVLSSLEYDAIRRITPAGEVTTLVADERIVWPDSFAAGPDGSIYFATSQIHLGLRPAGPYRIFRLVP